MRCRFISVVVVFLTGTLAAAACDRAPAPASVVVAPSVTHSLGIDRRSNEHVSLATSGAMVVAMWASSDAVDSTDVYAAVSGDGATTFSPPVRVNHLPGDARVNGEAPPQAALVPRATGEVDIVAVWTARRQDQNVLLTARSIDGGRSFGEASVVPNTSAPGHRGWHVVGVTPTGAVDVVWLDHRRVEAPAAASASHQHHGAAAGPAPKTSPAPKTTYDSVAEAQKSDLYYARLDGAAKPRALTAGVCFCCKTAMAHAAGKTYLAWRHVYAGDMRDIAFAVSTDDGRAFAPPVRVSEDHWSIAGCPDDGPSMAVDAEGRVHVVWPTMVTEGAVTVKTLFHAMTSDGRTFSPRVRVGGGATPAHHPRVVVAADGSLVVAWDEPWGEGSRVRIARGAVSTAGPVTFTVEPPAEPLTGRYPALATTTDAVLLAWVTGVGQSSRVGVERR